jgi:uncharacterized protein VirK/YbjX
MTTFVRAFVAMHGEFQRAKGGAAALKRSVGSLRALAFPALMRQMSTQGYLRRVERKRGHDGQPWDPFHFISHPGYLVRGYTLAQRFEAALHHDRHQAALFDDAALDHIYGPEGYLLWSAEVDGHQFAMRLGLAGEESLEGDLCVRLTADGQSVGSMNFVWSDGAMFGRDSGPTIFITRNQTHTWPELAIFRACFKQNSPPYFCLAALSGLALACGLTDLYAVHHAAQMSYEPKYAASFRNSYDEFWEKFNAQRVTPQAFRLSLPLELRDLSELKSKHRSRAEARRRSWGAVGQSAGAALARHLRRTDHEQPQRPAQAMPGRSVSAWWAVALLAQAVDGLQDPVVLALAA